MSEFTSMNGVPSSNTSMTNTTNMNGGTSMTPNNQGYPGSGTSMIPNNNFYPGGSFNPSFPQVCPSYPPQTSFPQGGFPSYPQGQTSYPQGGYPPYPQGTEGTFQPNAGNSSFRPGGFGNSYPQ